MKTITHIIFDVDGTLYEPVKELDEVLYGYWVKRLSDHLAVRPSVAEEQFIEARKTYISSTLALVSFGLGEPRQIIKQAEHHMRPYHKRYIKKDRNLIKIFKRLKHDYTLCTLRNGTNAGTRYILSLLGFSARSDKRKIGYGPFDYIFPTVELGTTKPDLAPFENARYKLDVPAEHILMVGDREPVDLKVAKDLGMKTAYVDWGRATKVDPMVTDVVIDTIYDIKELIVRD